MKHGKSISTLSVFSRFKSPTNGECAVDAQAAHRAIRLTEDAAPPVEPPSSSKSPLSILKLFVNRIRPRAGATETHYTDTLTTAVQERREAALRERGLLPPLDRNKDLSRRERERDQRLPVIEDSLETIPSPGDAQPMTPANQIKKEWEAKKRIWEEEERERLNRFRFGTRSTAVNVPQAHGQPSSPLSASATSVPAMLAPSSCASADEDTLPSTLGASGAPKHRSPVDDSSLLQAQYPMDHLPTFIPITPLPAPLHACSASPLPSQTSAVIQAGFELEPSWCAAIMPGPLETTPFQEDAASPERQRSDPSCLVSSVSDSHTSLATPHTAGLSIQSTPDAYLRLSSVKGVPTIVEGPIEHGLPLEMAILNPDTEAQQIQLQVGQYPKSKQRKRRMVFSEDQSGRRLAFTTSLSNMRRSLTSTFRSGMVHKGLNSDGAHDGLSRQPRTTQLTGARSLDALTAPRRRAVAPTLHSQGSILLQTSAIEDEKARRVAELAYLG